MDTLVHVLGTTLLLTTYFWHFTEEAKRLPFSKTFGWFYKFLTFWSLTAQCIQYSLATILCFTSSKATRAWLSPLVDDIACMAFTSASSVTIQFYALQAITKGGLTFAEKPPAWISLAVHVFNGVLAVLDVIISERRTFGYRAWRLCLVFVASYFVWINVIKNVLNEFPYPFLNDMPQPQGLLLTAGLSAIVWFGIFMTGSMLARTSAKILGKPVEVKTGFDARDKAA